MRKIPKAPTIPEAEKIQTLINRMHADWPLTEKVVSADAEFLRRKHQIFVKAGFTDNEALQLILRK